MSEAEKENRVENEVSKKINDNSRHMKEHRFVAFTTSARFDKSRATALDLNTATSLLLDVLHISTTLSDDLSAQVETGDWLKIDWDALIRPFAL
jgi:hypothetical protein